MKGRDFFVVVVLVLASCWTAVACVGPYSMLTEEPPVGSTLVTASETTWPVCVTDSFRVLTDQGWLHMDDRTFSVAADASVTSRIQEAESGPATEPATIALWNHNGEWLRTKFGPGGNVLYQEWRRVSSRVPGLVDEYTLSNWLLDPDALARRALVDEGYAMVDVVALQELVASHVVTPTGSSMILGRATVSYDIAMDNDTGYSLHRTWLMPSGLKLAAERTSPSGDVIWQWIPSGMTEASDCLSETRQIGLQATSQRDYLAVQSFAPPDGMPAPVPLAAHLLYSENQLPAGYVLTASAFITATMSVVDQAALPGWMVAQEVAGQEDKLVVVLQGDSAVDLPLPQLMKYWPPSWGGSLGSVLGGLYGEAEEGQFDDGTSYRVMLTSSATEVPPEVEALDFQVAMEWIQKYDVQVVIIGYGVTASELVALADALRGTGS